MKAAADPNVYEDGIERRTLDLRPEGIACIPLLGLSNFQSIRTGTEERACLARFAKLKMPSLGVERRAETPLQGEG